MVEYSTTQKQQLVTKEKLLQLTAFPYTYMAVLFFFLSFSVCLALSVFPTLHGKEPVSIWQAFDNVTMISFLSAWGALYLCLSVCLSVILLSLYWQPRYNILATPRVALRSDMNYPRRCLLKEFFLPASLNTHTANFILRIHNYRALRFWFCNVNKVSIACWRLWCDLFLQAHRGQIRKLTIWHEAGFCGSFKLV